MSPPTQFNILTGSSKTISFAEVFCLKISEPLFIWCLIDVYISAVDQTDTNAPASDGPPPETQESSDKTTPPDTQQQAPPTTGNEGAEPEKPPEAKKPKKPTVRSVDLPIAEVTTSLTKKELDNMREKEVWSVGVVWAWFYYWSFSRCN